MQYLTYEQYTGMGGTLTETDFPRFEYKASRLIDQYTFNRLLGLTEPPEAVKMLMFELIALDQAADEAKVTSVSNDGYSESYAEVDYKSKAEALIKRYLAFERDAEGTPLLFRGV